MPEPSTTDVVLDITISLYIFQSDEDARELSREPHTRVWLPSGFRDFLIEGSLADRERLMKLLGSSPSADVLEQIKRNVLGAEAVKIHKPSREEIEAILGQDAPARMETACAETLRGISPEGLRRLAQGLLEELLALDLGTGPSPAAPAVSLHVGSEPDGSNPVREAVKRFGRKLVTKIDPIMERIGPRAIEWEVRKVAYAKRLAHPTRSRIASDGFQIFLVVVVFACTLNPLGSGIFVIARIGDFVVDGGLPRT